MSRSGYSSFLIAIIIFTIIQGSYAFGIGRKQSAGAVGTLLCYGVPATGVLIELYDEDTFDPDDLMATTESDLMGEFQIFGYSYEITGIAPKMHFYHKCNSEMTPCLRKFTMYIPDTFVESGVTKPSRPYDVGVLELSGQFSEESSECDY